MAINLDYEVIGTGSTGNAVRIRNIMFDCGMPFKKMKDALYKVDTLLITHSHSDHIKEKTLTAIRKQFPRIRVYANWHVAQRFAVDVPIGTAEFELKNGAMVVPFYGEHDIPVTGYAVDFGDCKVIYATDTCKIENPVPDWKYDAVFLESNYDPQKLAVIGKQYQKTGYDPFVNAKRHLSCTQCKAFYFGSRKDRESLLVELHQSKRFR